MLTIKDVKHTFETTSRTTHVADDPVARVMYYLSCISGIIRAGIPSWVTDYQNYEMYQGWGDIAQIVQFVEFYDPQTLIKAGCLINNAAMCGESENEFMDITQKIRSEFNVSDGCTFGQKRTRKQEELAAGQLLRRVERTEVQATIPTDTTDILPIPIRVPLLMLVFSA